MTDRQGKGKRTAPAPSRRGRALLTDAQWEVLRLLKTGRSNKQIAAELGSTEGTVKVHIRGILANLGLSNRTQIAIVAQDIVDSNDPEAA